MTAVIDTFDDVFQQLLQRHQVLDAGLARMRQTTDQAEEEYTAAESFNKEAIALKRRYLSDGLNVCTVMQGLFADLIKANRRTGLPRTADDVQFLWDVLQALDCTIWFLDTAQQASESKPLIAWLYVYLENKAILTSIGVGGLAGLATCATRLGLLNAALGREQAALADLDWEADEAVAGMRDGFLSPQTVRSLQDRSAQRKRVEQLQTERRHVPRQALLVGLGAALVTAGLYWWCSKNKNNSPALELARRCAQAHQLVDNVETACGDDGDNDTTHQTLRHERRARLVGFLDSAQDTLVTLARPLENCATECCPICYSGDFTLRHSSEDCAVFARSANELCCQHVVHKACMDRWLEQSNSCPVCRSPCEGSVVLSPTNIQQRSKAILPL
eukprot:TRINITY_DN6640_c0_g1_i1.p1 TRINITY_DN6640_c0_g1~~TRINITY_DN6640_c0_g1_i1.p1  ORF type:complete len:389 (+),score=67.88 TRINITY_DN6640_c0_g1_i1:33-1199(+)